ncbi:MAG: hypothetical protein CVU56_25025 [Deltaproteobacteria bacterium HGW-Deltaproteobacteria-14]|jgi:type II secretory pathway component GspD/PulD (secretin)|nr:MAG: hypothetical protein CVU56_25025 [Deltaproteobacteria bacterium HGW-Deltaproteobacteria-14]
MLTRIPTVLLLAVAFAAGPSGAHAAPGHRPPASRASDDSYRTDVIFLAHLPQGRAIALWERVIGPAGEARIIAGRAGTVVVYDTPPRLARFRDLLRALDVGDGDAHIYVRPVVHLAPSALAALIERILGDAGGRDALVLVPDDRASQLVIRTTPARYAVIDKLARRLDAPAGERERVVRRLTAPPDTRPEAP